jgi:aliphatic aldoxime dehydratase
VTKLMPPNWEPPYPAYTSDAKSLNASLLAVQGPGEADGKAAFADLTALLEVAPGRLHHEHVFFEDDAGCRNDLAVAYWQGPGDFAAWRAGAAAAAFFCRMEEGALGAWIESMSVSAGRFENSNSTLTIDWGVSRHWKTHEDRVHAYYGAMRDRIAVAEDGGLASPLGRLNRTRQDETLGRHLQVALPDNRCFIRTVQGWLDCDDAEREAFLNKIYPVYRQGVAFLQGNPLETNCICARLVTDADSAPSRPQSETLAWFLSLTDLESWTWNHPTHAAIFGAFQQHAREFDTDIRVLLGHEVMVVPQTGMHAEYHNCHNATGFLRCFEAVEM